MKTQYKYLTMEYDEGFKVWRVFNHKRDEELGYYDWNKQWKEWEYVPFENTAYTKECLIDLAHFISEMENK